MSGKGHTLVMMAVVGLSANFVGFCGLFSPLSGQL